MEQVTLTGAIAPTASTAVKSSPGCQVIAKTLAKLPDPETVRAQAMQAAGKGRAVNVRA